MKGRGGTSGPRELLRITQGGWVKTGSIPGAERGPQQGKQAREPSGGRKRVARSGRWGAERRAQNTEKDIRGRGCRPVCAYRAAVRLRPSGRPQRCPPRPRPRPPAMWRDWGGAPFRANPEQRGRAAAHRFTARAHCPLPAVDRSAGAAEQVGS